jgi:ferredoxin
LDGFVHPGNSIKEFFFPRHERIYSYRFKGRRLELEDCDPQKVEQLIIGARPCDAASLVILDHVFNWDYKDKFYNERRAATTVVTVGCATFDGNCFCTSVGLGPAAEKGSDAMLYPLGNGEYEVHCLTEKGKALFAGRTQVSDKTAKPAPEPDRKFDAQWVTERLKANYEDPAWKDIVLRCLGCGACAYTCPTCHCFDIGDEGTALGGSRVKNWDSCQFGMFTMHASGHNPRANQGQRQRQRIQHKFRIYPEKFGAILCTGCGNCTRNCPVGLGVLNTLAELRETALRETSEARG